MLLTLGLRGDFMILEMIFAPIFMLGRFIISLIPNVNYSNGGLTGTFYEFLHIGLYFFGAAPFVMCIACVVLWTTAEISWSVFEWLYKKIPGVD